MPTEGQFFISVFIYHVDDFLLDMSMNILFDV